MFRIYKIVIFLILSESHVALGQLTHNDLQTAIDLAAKTGVPLNLSGLEFTIADHIYVYADIKWIGGKFFVTGETAHGWAVIHCGSKKYGDKGTTWTGSISGAVFIVNEGMNAKDHRLINIHRATDIKIENCTFDFRSAQGVFGGISAMNHSAFCRSPKRANLSYVGNTILANQAANGSEGLNAAFTDGIIIEGNQIHGMGDDVIGLHDVSDFVIRNNVSSATDGRIYIASCQNGIISGNIHRHTTDTPGSLIHLERERDYMRTHPRNIVIEDNKLYHFGEGTQATYGIRVRGAENISILNNRIYSSVPQKKWGVRLEPQKDTSTKDYPEGVSPVMKHLIVGNVCPDIREGAIGSTKHNVGPVITYGNQSPLISLLSPKGSVK